MEAKPIHVRFQRDEGDNIIAMITERNIYACTYVLGKDGEWFSGSSKQHPLYLAAVKIAWEKCLSKLITTE